jgi:hypothetical protein
MHVLSCSTFYTSCLHLVHFIPQHCTICWSIFCISQYQFPLGLALLESSLHGQMPCASLWSKHTIPHLFPKVVYMNIFSQIILGRGRVVVITLCTLDGLSENSMRRPMCTLVCTSVLCPCSLCVHVYILAACMHSFCCDCNTVSSIWGKWIMGWVTR